MAPTQEQATAFTRFREFARPFRFRVVPDREGWPIIPGKLGQIEWYCGGVDCHCCPLPGQFALAVYTQKPRSFAKIWAIPGVVRYQTGDGEMRAVFPLEALEQVGEAIWARRKRPLSPEEARRRGGKTAYRATSRPATAREGVGEGKDI